MSPHTAVELARRALRRAEGSRVLEQDTDRGSRRRIAQERAARDQLRLTRTVQAAPVSSPVQPSGAAA